MIVFVGRLPLEIQEPPLHQVATFGAGRAPIVVDTVPQDALVSGMTIEQTEICGPVVIIMKCDSLDHADHPADLRCGKC